MKQCRCDLRH